MKIENGNWQIWIMFNGSDFHQAALVDEGSELENEGELVDFSAEVFTEGDEADVRLGLRRYSFTQQKIKWKRGHESWERGEQLLISCFDLSNLQEILQDIIDNVDADSEDKVRLGLGGTRAVHRVAVGGA